MSNLQPLVANSAEEDPKAFTRCMTRVKDLLEHIGFPKDNIEDKSSGICAEVHGIQRGTGEWIGLLILLLVSCFLIYIMGYGAYWASHDYEVAKRKKRNQTLIEAGLEPGMELESTDYPFQEFMLPPGINSYGELFSTGEGWQIIGAGLVGGLVFGFIDNAGLWFGMDALDAFLPGGELVRAGFGNTFSDVLGAFIGTFVAIIVAKKAKIDLEGNPFWINAIGMLIGCLVGVGIPYGTMWIGKKIGGAGGKIFLLLCALGTICAITSWMITMGRAREFDMLSFLDWSSGVPDELEEDIKTNFVDI